jgi:3-deoxy-D-manno-octulosonic-acid transferase
MLQKRFPDAVLWSKIEETGICPQVIIINCIGILSSLYQYANIAIIGGGFGAGIHNILEPACFGLAVLFGPKYHQFDEAIAMIKNRTGFSFKNYQEFENQLLNLLSSKEKQAAIKIKQVDYLQKQAGATDLILSKII